MSNEPDVYVTSAAAIDSILRSTRKEQRKTRPRKVRTFDPQAFRYAGPKPKRCRCGECAACIDSARWERIFQEKFADPNYYDRPLAGNGSSLNW